MQRPGEVADLDLIRQGLYMIVYTHAARHDAQGDPERLARLRATANSEASQAYRRTGHAQPVLDEIAEAMGDGWEPTGVHAAKLEEILAS